MADAAYADPGALPSLGIGSILSRAFSILGKRFPLLFGLVFAVQLVFVAISLATPALSAPAFVDPATGAFNVAALGPLALYTLVFAIVYAVIQGVVTVAAYDTATGRPSRVGDYFGAVFRNIVPLVVVSILSAVAVYVGLILLIVPGLWVAAVLSVVIPAVVIDAAGFDAFGRSARLTKEYRWPIVGLLVIVFVIVFGISLALGAALVAIVGVTGAVEATNVAAAGVTTGVIVFQLINAAIGAVTYAFLAVAIALLFARLKEIKEGLGFEDLSNVFD